MHGELGSVAGDFSLLDLVALVAKTKLFTTKVHTFLKSLSI